MKSLRLHVNFIGLEISLAVALEQWQITRLWFLLDKDAEWNCVCKECVWNLKYYISRRCLGLLLNPFSEFTVNKVKHNSKSLLQESIKCHKKWCASATSVPTEQFTCHSPVKPGLKTDCRLGIHYDCWLVSCWFHVNLHLFVSEYYPNTDGALGWVCPQRRLRWKAWA